MFYRAPLDWLNFFPADRGGLGAYVGVFLLTQAHWNQATIGAVLTLSGLIGITLHTPIGALIDATNYKRGLIIGGTCALAASALAIAWAPTFPVARMRCQFAFRANAILHSIDAFSSALSFS